MKQSIFSKMGIVLLSLTIMLCISLPVWAADSATFSLSASGVSGSNASALKPGEQFTVNVNVTDNSQLGALDYKLNYDSSKVTPVKVDEGSVVRNWRSTESNGKKLAFASSTKNTGIVAISLACDGTQGITGSGPLAVVTFQVNSNASAGSAGLTQKITTAADRNENSLSSTPAIGNIDSSYINIAAIASSGGGSTPAAPTVKSIALGTAPTKTAYTIGTDKTLDLAGATIKVTYSDGTTKDVAITSAMCSGYDLTKAGDQTVTVSFEGQTAGFTIKVSDATPTPTAPVATETPVVAYSAHVQNDGWEDWSKDGATNGTTGEGLRVEALQVKILNKDGSESKDLGVTYSAHVQNIGWQMNKENGQTAGTTGEALRMEALKMDLTGAQKDNFDIYYRVHSQDFGWMNWAKDGEMAGTTGYGFRIEAVQIVIVPKGSAVPALNPVNTTDKSSSVAENIQVLVHGRNYGWNQGWQQSNQMTIGTAGTTGEGLRLEAIQLKDSNPNLTLRYQAHVQNIGWTDEVTEGYTAGTTGRGLRVEAIKIRATGDDADKYEISYQVHVQNKGWTDWVKSGEAAGTIGQSLQLEAIRVRVTEK